MHANKKQETDTLKFIVSKTEQDEDKTQDDDDDFNIYDCTFICQKQDNRKMYLLNASSGRKQQQSIYEMHFHKSRT